MRLGDPRVVAVLSTLVGFSYLIEGFTNRQRVERTNRLLAGPYTSRHGTYDLRRLKRKGLIRRRNHGNRYHVTPLGRRVAVLFTKTYGRVLTPGLALLNPQLAEEIAGRTPLSIDVAGL